MAAALALLGNAPGRKLAVLGDMLEMGEGGLALHAALAEPIATAKADLVFASGRQMKALWDALPPTRRGAYAEDSAALAPKLMAAVKRGDTVLVKGSLGSRMAVIVEALKGRAG
jgi:UDP-N-acetylmuramoyl-tripeptide--D-alanyl-D-alanine ligase